MVVVALVSVTLQLVTTVAAVTLGQAPRWRRVRWFGAVACTAALYSGMNLLGAAVFDGDGPGGVVMRVNLFVGTLHAMAWLGYTFSAEDGRFSSLPSWAIRWGAVGVVLSASLSLTGLAIQAGSIEPLHVPWLNVHYERASLTAWGGLASAIPFAFTLVSFAQYVKRARAGEPGAASIVVGFLLFLATAVEELAVALGWLEFIYLADVGYVFVVAPVAWQQLSRFRDDANQLDALSAELTSEVQRRTEERDSARKVLIEQQRLAALGRLSAGVGHEINNPLQFLRFNLEELHAHDTLRTDPEAIDLVDRSLEGVDRIRQVVEDLRTYVRPGSAAVSVLDVRDVVRSAVRVGTPQWRQGITVSTSYGEVPLVEGNEGRLVQVVLNPLVNGAQAMLQAGDPSRLTLHVRTYTSERNEAVIEVRDEGPGFAPELMAQLGEPYVTTKADRGGTGLGLFVTRGIVEAHGGTLQFTNAADGGACVRIRLPGMRASARTPDPTPIPYGIPIISRGDRAGSGPRHSVLLVEDDAPALRALVRGLEAEGLRVTGFTHGAEALAWLARHASEVQVVVTDLMMPGMSGWEFARHLGEQYPALHATLVVLTGGAATDEARAFTEQPGLLVLEKPITRQALAKALRSRIREAGNRVTSET